MDFSIYDCLNQIFIEGIKYILIAHYFLGLEFRKGKRKYMLFIYFLFLLLIEYWNNQELIFLYYYAWGIVLLTGVFEGGVIEKIRAFIVILFLVPFVDELLILFYLAFSNIIIENGNVKIGMIVNSIGAVLWGIMTIKGKKIQQYTKNFWKSLSNQEYILSLFVLVLSALFVGGMQGYLDNTMSVPMTVLAFMFGFLVMITSAIVLVSLLNTKRSKRQLEEINRLNVRYLELQKKYYENSLKQYEDMRSFRHDINHHLYILSELSRENKIDDLKEYIKKMVESYETMKGIHTGNFIADCIISHTLYKLQERKRFHFDLEGHFPEDCFLEDIDFCILLSNLLENAEEALEKVNGETFLEIEIKSFHQWFYLTIRNNTISNEVNFQTTSKSDKRNHGFGIQSVRRIVEKYHGSVVCNCENGVVEVKTKFDQSKLK